MLQRNPGNREPVQRASHRCDDVIQRSRIIREIESRAAGARKEQTGERPDENMGAGMCQRDEEPYSCGDHSHRMYDGSKKTLNVPDIRPRLDSIAIDKARSGYTPG